MIGTQVIAFTSDVSLVLQTIITACGLETFKFEECSQVDNNSIQQSIGTDNLIVGSNYK